MYEFRTFFFLWVFLQFRMWVDGGCRGYDSAPSLLCMNGSWREGFPDLVMYFLQR